MISAPVRIPCVLALLAAVFLLTGCGEEAETSLPGDPERGREVILAYGCDSCHAIPGIPGANSRVGPPLGRAAHRAYIAGVLPNSPENMVRWIRAPEAIDPRTAMPDMGVSETDAWHITAYLYRLK